MSQETVKIGKHTFKVRHVYTPDAEPLNTGMMIALLDRAYPKQIKAMTGKLKTRKKASDCSSNNA